MPINILTIDAGNPTYYSSGVSNTGSGKKIDLNTCTTDLTLVQRDADDPTNCCDGGTGGGGAPTPAEICADVTAACPMLNNVFYDGATDEWVFVYIDSTELRIPNPSPTLDLNTTVSDQTGGNYGGGAPVAPPAAPDDGDVHVEQYDDFLVYWVATGGAFPVASALTIPIGAAITNIYNSDGTIPAGVNRVATFAAGASLDFGGALQIDGDTGKVTIPGVLDPILYVGSPNNCAAATPNVAVGQAGFYVSDGTDGFPAESWVHVDSTGNCNGVSAPGVGGGPTTFIDFTNLSPLQITNLTQTIDFTQLTGPQTTNLTNILNGNVQVLTTNSVAGDGTLGNELQLVNDAAAPGNNFYYGTDGTGTKGWFTADNLSSILTGDFTQIANRTQTFGGFDQTWNALGIWTVFANDYNLRANNVGSLTAVNTSGTATNMDIFVDRANYTASLGVDVAPLGSARRAYVRAAGASPNLELYQEDAAGNVGRMDFLANQVNLSQTNGNYNIANVVNDNAAPRILATLANGDVRYIDAASVSGVNFLTGNITGTQNVVHDGGGFDFDWTNSNSIQIAANGIMDYGSATTAQVRVIADAAALVGLSNTQLDNTAGRYEIVTAPPASVGGEDFVVRDPITGELRLIASAAIDTNIYNADGAIPAATARAATLGAGSSLTFTGGAGTLLQIDGDTGKVTIPGVLDPTLYVGSANNCATATPSVTAGQAGLYVSDGTDGFPAETWVHIDSAGNCNAVSFPGAAGGPTVGADNGLHVDGPSGDIYLGGNLVETTNVFTDGFFLQFRGSNGGVNNQTTRFSMNTALAADFDPDFFLDQFGNGLHAGLFFTTVIGGPPGILQPSLQIDAVDNNNNTGGIFDIGVNGFSFLDQGPLSTGSIAYTVRYDWLLDDGTSAPVDPGTAGQVVTSRGAGLSPEWTTTGGSPVETLDEGGSLTVNTTSFNFVGAGVTATNVGNDVTVTIPGGAGTDTNYAEDDLTATGNRTHAFNANSLTENFTSGSRNINAVVGNIASTFMQTNGSVTLQTTDTGISEATLTLNNAGSITTTGEFTSLMPDPSVGNPQQLRFMESTAGGTNYTAFQASATMAANVTYTLPNADGTAGQVLSTNGSGGLSWVAGGADTNYAEDDLTATGTRTHTWATNDLNEDFTAGNRIESWVNGVPAHTVTKNVSGFNSTVTGLVGDATTLNTDSFNGFSVTHNNGSGTVQTLEIGPTNGARVDYNNGVDQVHWRAGDNGATAELFARTNDVDNGAATNGQVLTLVDNSTGEVEFQDAPVASRYTQDFNATTDWSAGAGVFTLTVLAAAHGRGTDPIVSVKDSGTNDVVGVQTTISVTGLITLTVPDTPDGRFAGRLTAL